MDGTGAERQAEATRSDIFSHAGEQITQYSFWKTNVGDITTCCGRSPALAQWREKETILPELSEVLDLVFDGLTAR